MAPQSDHRPYISKNLRRKIADLARQRCGYCLTAEEFTAMPMTIEHIIPLVAGGTSDEENLWLSCPICNGHKAMQTHHPDPESKQIVPLFNPRQQIWSEHFAWSESGVEIIGRTPIGRATVIAVQLNDERLTRARRRWVLAGWHPPVDKNLKYKFKGGNQ